MSCGSSRKTIGVLFDNITEYPPYYVVMDIPINHTPVCWSGTDLWETFFEFEDSSYIYFLKYGFNPNYTRIKVIGDSLFNQRLGYANHSYFNPQGDSLYSLVYEGVDTNGLYWKDVHYLLPDSLCLIKRKDQIVSTWKSDKFRVTIGYARVQAEHKDLYDKALKSFNIIRINEADTSLLKKLDTSYNFNAKFRYMTDYKHAVINGVSKIDPYIESKRK